MNLWIRTQKKDRLCLTHNFVIREANKNGYYAVAENRNKNTIEYGIYSTKERALEVLNEIELALGCKRTAFNNTIVFVNVLENVNSMVYEMPEE